MENTGLVGVSNPARSEIEGATLGNVSCAMSIKSFYLLDLSVQIDISGQNMQMFGTSRARSHRTTLLWTTEIATLRTWAWRRLMPDKKTRDSQMMLRRGQDDIQYSQPVEYTKRLMVEAMTG